MDISISISSLISYDIVMSITVASIVSLLIWFILRFRNSNKKNKEHDKELFKQPPQKEDCPICFQQMPLLLTGRTYMSCCGKEVCSGCVYAPLYDDQGNTVDNKKCSFCRAPRSNTNEESNERLKKRMEANDSIAIYNVGFFYSFGMYGYPKDHTKALELFHRAAKLGHAQAYFHIDYAYHCGRGVEVDKKKGTYYYELAAMGGCETARHSLGCNEVHEGNWDRALKHFMIAVRCGDHHSLKQIEQLCSNEHATKEDYAKALRAYQAYLYQGEIKSFRRDEAAGAHEYYRYLAY